MAPQATMRMRFLHERYCGRPSCPKCGELMIAPEFSECFGCVEIRHVWRCEGCENQFDTLVEFEQIAA
jgi:hypothetical protein